MNSDLLFDGKTYISCKRAASISGYVTDYIGQLCRQNKLECKLVGRSWYVSLESLIAHKNSYLTGTKSKPNQIFKNTSLLPTLSEYELKSKEVIDFPAEEPKLLLESPVHPIAIKKIYEDRAPRIATHTVHTSFAHSFPKVVSFAFALILSVMSFQMLVTMNPHASATYGKSAHVVSENVKDITEILQGELEASVFTAAQTLVTDSIVAMAQEIINAFTNTKEKIILALQKKAPQQQEKIEQTIIASRPTQGVVVVPVKENINNDEVVNKIRNTFSDEVTVAPSDEGSGVVTPVFRESKGDDYLYVLVPIPN